MSQVIFYLIISIQFTYQQINYRVDQESKIYKNTDTEIYFKKKKIINLEQSSIIPSSNGVILQHFLKQTPREQNHTNPDNIKNRSQNEQNSTDQSPKRQIPRPPKSNSTEQQPGQSDKPQQYPQDDDGIGWFTKLVIIVFLIAIISLGVYAYLKYKERQIYIQHCLQPEKAIEKKQLNFLQNSLHKSWFLNDSKHVQNDQQAAQKVLIEYDQENVLGKYIRLVFKQPPGHINTVIALQTIEEQDNAYFEVEIDQNNFQSDIQIGLCTEKEYDPDFKLGTSTSSIAFHSICGKVEMASKLLYDYQFTAVYGETLGLGMRWSDGRVWLSYNGRFLNPPSKSEKFKDKDKEKDEQQQAQDKQIEIDLDPNSKKAEEEAAKKKITMPTSRKLFPAISTNGPCTVNLNIGGQAFRISQKELAHGLLFTKDLF